MCEVQQKHRCMMTIVTQSHHIKLNQEGKLQKRRGLILSFKILTISFIGNEQNFDFALHISQLSPSCASQECEFYTLSESRLVLVYVCDVKKLCAQYPFHLYPKKVKKNNKKLFLTLQASTLIIKDPKASVAASGGYTVH